MKNPKYPIRYISVINFETDEMEEVAEHPDDRRRRLSREAAQRKSRFFADKGAIENARKEALTMAWKLAYDGKPHPIHFDVEIFGGPYHRVERYSLLNAAYSKHVFRDDQIVGAFGSSSVRKNRPASVPADVIHSLTLSVGGTAND